MKLIRSAVMHDGQDKEYLLNYYELSVNVDYEDIGSVLDVFPTSYSYNGFSLSGDDDDGRGFRKSFYSLGSARSYCKSHGAPDGIDTFSFNMLDCGENISFNFSIGSNDLTTFGNTVSLDIDELICKIEENVSKNK